MIKSILITVFFVFAAPPLLADTTMDANAFNTYTQGKTIFFQHEGRYFGGEQYLSNNRVRWSYNGGDCLEGVWYQQDKLICFVYEDDPKPKCWAFSQTNNGLAAYFNGTMTDAPLYEVRKTDRPLQCLGPDVGV